jgi:hypothetical protein
VLPTFIRPCIPTTAKAIPRGDAWLHEPKLDGYGFQIVKDGRQVRLYSRSGRTIRSGWRYWGRRWRTYAGHNHDKTMIHRVIHARGWRNINHGANGICKNHRMISLSPRCGPMN